MNDEADFLLLSGLKHFRFCRRRWALVHLEQQWEENALTLEGNYLHERVHDASFTERRGSILLSRGMPVSSRTLRVTGVCDMVELIEDPQGVPIQGRKGRYRVYPVEYKHGRPDPSGADEWHLCGQALCLEEMLVTEIPEGAIYYGETRSRLRVSLTPELRASVTAAIAEMHDLFARGSTPKVKPQKACRSCSLREVCQPKLLRSQSAEAYVHAVVQEDV